MSGIDERPIKQEAPLQEEVEEGVFDREIITYKMMDELLEAMGHEGPQLIRIRRNEIRRVRKRSALIGMFIGSILILISILGIGWAILINNPVIIFPSIALVFLVQDLKEDIQIYRDNREDVAEERGFVWYRRKT